MKRWIVLDFDGEKVLNLQTALNVNKTVCKILVQRMLDTFEKCKAFFRPQLSDLHDPWLMKDMKKAVNRIEYAIATNEKMLVFGDYDVDGTTSVACVYQFLKGLHPDVLFYIPHRYREGYGISKAGIDFAKANNVSLVISLDCGIKSVDLIDYARVLNIDFIVCDHHLPEEELPKAVAILNAKQPGCNYPNKDLCGCGVGFKLMMALAETFNLPDTSYLQYIDLAAIAIAADIVPITGENRIIAYFGLKKVNEDPCTGIGALKQLAGQQKLMLLSNLVFVIAPRVNAAGRMDDAKKAVQLFIEKDFIQALAFAEMLHNDNSERKEADSSITEQALDYINKNEVLKNRKSTVVYNEQWHKGVVGIVASRLIETYHRPTVVLTKSGEVAAGSARSVPGFNLYEAIYACREYLLGYGGHFAAAGMTLMPDKIEAFSRKFEEVVSATIAPEQLIPQIVIDAEIEFSNLNLSLYHLLQQMEPFGPENMRPVFITKKVYDTGYSKIVKEQHVRFVLKQDGVTFTGIGFGMADKFHLIETGQPLDIAYTLDINEWNNETKLQLKMIDFRLSSFSETPA